MQQVNRTFNPALLGACFLALTLLAACATKPAPKYSSDVLPELPVTQSTRIFEPTSVTMTPKPAQEVPRRTVICANDKARVHVEGAPGVELLADRQERLEQQIQERLDAKRALNTSIRDNREYEVMVTVTSLKNGSPIGRFLSGKLGEIEINSTIRLIDPIAGRQLSQFGIRQNLTQGGFTGAATTLRDAEEAFAEGVATALTGQTSTVPVTKQLSQR